MAMADSCKKKSAPKKWIAPKEYSREVVENCASTNGDDDFKQPTTKRTRLSNWSLSLTKSCTSKNCLLTVLLDCVTSTELASITKTLIPKTNTGLSSS